MAGTTVAICAYNEAANIAHLLEHILACAREGEDIAEILVVSSGSTDGTDDIVRALAGQNPRLRLVAEETRRGKLAAVNTVLREARSDRIVLVDADALPAPGALQRLAAGLEQAGVGGIGTRNVPVNANETLVARAASLMWEVHHRVSAGEPMLGGDIIAFRRLITALTEEDGVNDDYLIECDLRRRGLSIVYDPLAMTYMRVPTSVADFVRQRRRIHFGFLKSRKTRPLKSTQKLSNVLPATLALLRERPSVLPLMVLLFGINSLSKLLAYLDLATGHSHTAWVPSPSTKARINLPSDEEPLEPA